METNKKDSAKISGLKIKMEQLKIKRENRKNKYQNMNPNDLKKAVIARKEAQRDWRSMTIIFSIFLALGLIIFPIVRMHIKVSFAGQDIYGVSENIGLYTLFNEGSIFRAVKDFSNLGDWSSIFGGGESNTLFGSLFESLISSLTNPIKQAVADLKTLIPYTIATGIVYVISLIIRITSGIIYWANKKTLPCIILQAISFALFTGAMISLYLLTKKAEGFMPNYVTLELKIWYGIILEYITAAGALFSVIMRRCLKDISVD
ncbi:MAG: hypothetical protein K5917_05670 [Clostridiales bacterium]|nr:hypothetical protein [Clostridiales bacterium]